MESLEVQKAVQGAVQDAAIANAPPEEQAEYWKNRATAPSEPAAIPQPTETPRDFGTVYAAVTALAKAAGLDMDVTGAVNETQAREFWGVIGTDLTDSQYIAHAESRIAALKKTPTPTAPAPQVPAPTKGGGVVAGQSFKTKGELLEHAVDEGWNSDRTIAAEKEFDSKGSVTV